MHIVAKHLAVFTAQIQVIEYIGQNVPRAFGLDSACVVAETVDRPAISAVGIDGIATGARSLHRREVRAGGMYPKAISAAASQPCAAGADAIDPWSAAACPGHAAPIDAGAYHPMIGRAAGGLLEVGFG